MQISVLLAEQIAELFLMILMGYVIVKLGLVTDDDSKILSKIVLYIVYCDSVCYDQCISDRLYAG